MTYAKDINLQQRKVDRIQDINFLAPNNFEFSIDNLTYPNAGFLVTAVNLPNFSIGSANIAMATRVSPQHADKVTYENLSLTFIVDENMVNYLELHDWMLAQVIQNDNYPEDSKRRDCKLIVNSSNNNAVRRITFVDAFPIDLSPLEFTSTIGSVDYLTCTSTFAYSYFKIE